MKAFFVRHGESASNVLGICNSDPAVALPLTVRGRRQAHAVGLRLAGRKPGAIYVSQLPRARETAEIIAHRFSCAIRVEPRLNDRRSGFEGRPVQEYLAAASRDPLRFKAEGGESYLEQKQRVRSFIDDLAGQPFGEVLVVTHHEVLQIVNGHYRRLADLEMWHTPIAHGQVLEFDLAARVQP